MQASYYRLFPAAAARSGKDTATGIDRALLRTLDSYAATLGLAVRDAFALDYSFTHLNHGSYGTAPRVVMKAATHEMLAIERFPDDYFRRRALKQFTGVCEQVARFVGAEPGSVVLVRSSAGLHRPRCEVAPPRFHLGAADERDRRRQHRPAVAAPPARLGAPPQRQHVRCVSQRRAGRRRDDGLGGRDDPHRAAGD